MLIRVTNWLKYNPRAGAKAGWSWWRFQNDFFEDPDFYELPASHLLIWVALCCARSRSSDDAFRINVKQLADRAKTTVDVAKDAISILTKIKKIEIIEDCEFSRTDTYANVHESTDTFPTDGRTDGRTNIYVNGRASESSPRTYPDPDILRQVWNQERGSLPECLKLTKSRQSSARQRLAENPDPEYWRGVVRKIAKSPFCLGTNDRSWRATFDYLLKPNTHIKISEGIYDQRSAISRALPILTAVKA